jgi:hypothetical protein
MQVFPDQLVEVMNRPGLGRASGDGQQIVHHRCRPFPCLTDVHYWFSQLAVLCQSHQQQVGITDDPRKNIIKIVRNSAGHQANDLHLLCQAQLLFQVEHVGDIPLNGNIIDRPAGPVKHRRNVHFLGIQGAVFFPVHDPAIPCFTAGNRLPHLLIISFVMFTALQDTRVFTQGLAGCITGDFFENRIDIQDCPAAVGDNDDFVRLLYC